MVILFDQFHLPEDIFEVVFATQQQKIVAKVLISEMLANGGEINKTLMSHIATQLHEGKFVTKLEEPEFKGKQVKLSYNKRQFYDRILTPMRAMGLIEYDLYKKTYKVSEKFNTILMQVGRMWIRYVQSPKAKE